MPQGAFPISDGPRNGAFLMPHGSKGQEMTDETEPKNGTPNPAATAGEAGPQQAAEPEPDWKALARKWVKRSKENAEKARLYDELKAGQMTEAEKLAAAESRVAELELERDRAQWADELADETGVPAKVLRMMGCSTRDDLEEKAKTIAEAMPKGQPSMPVVHSDGGHATFEGPETASDFLRQSYYTRNR